MTHIKDMPVLSAVPDGGYVLVTDPSSDPTKSIFAKVPASAVGSGSADVSHALLDDLAGSGSSGGSSSSAIYNVRDYGAKGDGVTDDTTAIQSALNASAGVATVFVPDTGHPYMTGTLSLPSGTNLLLYGMLKAQPTLTDALVTIRNAHNVTIRGTGIIDANGLAQVNPTRGLGGIGTQTASNVRVSGITIQNAHFWNMNVTQSNNVVFDSVTMLDTVAGIGGAAAEFAVNCNDCWLVNSNIDGTNNIDYVFAFYGGVTNSGAIGNVLKNGGAGTTTYAPPGIGVLSDTGQPAPCSNIVIADNICYGNGGGGISVLGMAGSLATGIVVANNRSYNNCKNAGAFAGADILIEYATDVIVTGNQSSASGTGTGACTGIFLGPNSSHVMVSGNQIFNIGAGSTATTSSGIWNAGSPSLMVSGNHIYDRGSPQKMQYSVIGASGSNTAYVGNVFELAPYVGLQADSTMANVVQGQWNVSSISAALYAQSLGVIGAAGTNRSIGFVTDTHNRWVLLTTPDPEGGGNAGSDFEILRYNDAGAAMDAPLTINRQTGQATLLNPVTIGGTTATAAGLSLITAPGHARGLGFASGTANRWVMLATGDAEGVGNVGSDFQILRFNDAGAALDAPLAINRQTAKVTMAGALSVGDVGVSYPHLATLAGQTDHAFGLAWDGANLRVYVDGAYVGHVTPVP